MYMYPEKFELFHALSKMLREAPQAVREKWSEGWTEIYFSKTGFTSYDSCGCCGTSWPPGWYGENPRGFHRFICGPHGEKEYKTEGWCDTDSH